MLLAMGALLVVGFTDDKYGLPIWMRFLLEILVVMAMIVFNGNMIDNFYGLFGLHAIPTYVALPLSVFTGVGIINAINLIDGVDGYSCGYISITCLSFSVIFYYSQIYTLFSLCLICACSVVPFFLHNVFGVKSKMFIGDGGTLMLGTLMVVLAFSMLRTGSMCETLGSYNISLVALCLAELALPVIDTLRVMTRRMVNGMSPFKPDKTHLHHLFIDLNFPHFIAGFICILLNVVVMVTWLVSWIMGAEANIQFAVVCVSMVLVDPILYNVLRYHERHNTCLYHQIRRFAGQMNPETTRFWKWMNHWIDNELY
ncbi:MAG: MraY family glycosyltransferase [Bacteroidales bacterium]|nr:MraY family glycosyltransferase [Bacteroidales bacterium]